MSGILSGTSVTATAVSAAALRVYFQDEQGGIREGTYPTPGSPSGWGVSKTPIFTAKLFTPLSVISWDNGQQIRVYTLSDNNTLQEWAYEGSSWTAGYLTKSNFPAASISSLSAVYWSQNGGAAIRLYAQDATTNAIQEYVNGNPWVKGATLPVALTGSSIAAVMWLQNGPHLRVYYQDPAHNLKEHAYDSSWYVGQFNPGKAPRFTPITALGWYDTTIKIRVYWENLERNLLTSNWVNGWSAVSKAIGPLVGTEVSAVEWNNGASVRIYSEGSSDDIVEECSDSNESSWYTGQGVATTTGGTIVPL
jgi:hypothetical protein